MLEKIPLVRELRGLMTTYLEAIGSGGEGVQPWQDSPNGIAALGSAMHALVVLDPDASDVFKQYLSKRDGKHEGYCWDAILPAFVASHGWRSRDDIRFGIYATLNRAWGGRSLDGECAPGLLDAASRLTTVAQFIQMLAEEATPFVHHPNLPRDIQWFLMTIKETLNEAVPYQAELAKELDRRLAHCPSFRRQSHTSI